MRTKILLFILISAFASLNVYADKFITITITKINGNGTGNYESVSRVSEDVIGITGEVIGKNITIGCTGPGTNACPSSRPVGGGPIENVDESIANYLDQRLIEIEQMIIEGIHESKQVRTVSITLSTGETKLFKVTSNWVGTDSNNSKIEVHLESYEL